MWRKKRKEKREEKGPGRDTATGDNNIHCTAIGDNIHCTVIDDENIQCSAMGDDNIHRTEIGDDNWPQYAACVGGKSPQIPGSPADLACPATGWCSPESP